MWNRKRVIKIPDKNVFCFKNADLHLESFYVGCYGGSSA